jgi:UDP-glucuronate 4-epimerase
LSTILVTGAAGFIGYHVAQRLLARGDEVVGLDNLNDYYDVRLKEARLARLQVHPGFKFTKLDIADREGTERLFGEFDIERVIHLAAQAGVRHSLVNPHVYITANLMGFLNVLEGCRHKKIRHLVFASSSSVYGASARMPFSVHDPVDHPISLYAATKKSNELMAHSYAHLYGLPCTGLRFFSVYGPWGRPDMAMFLFTRAILEGRPIDLFNQGQHRRDFTYIDDIVEGVVRVLDRIPERDPNWTAMTPDPATSFAPYQLYNLGSGQPVELMYVIELLEDALGHKARKNLLDIQPGDVPETYADVRDTVREVGFRPGVSIEEGVARFVSWYQEFYR